MELFRKLLALALCLAMCLSFVACGDDEKEDKDDKEKEEKIEEVEGDPDCKHEWGPESSENKDSCTTETKVTRVCQKCDRLEIIRTIPATGHILDSEGKKCEICGKKKRNSCKHEDVEEVIVKEATCTEDGEKNYVCDNCDFVQYSNSIYHEGHDYEYHEYKDPTCTEAGNEGYNTCTKCDYTSYEEIPANGHTYIAGKCKVCDGEQKDFSMIESSDSENSTVTIAPIEQKPFANNAAEIITYNGEIKKTSQKDKYKFTAAIDGLLSIKLSEVYDSVYFDVYVYNHLNEEIDSRTWMNNNEYFAVSVVEGEEYTIQINGNSGVSSYILTLGVQKPSIDISEYNVITDKIEFEKQSIDYTFTPTTNGTYNFAFSEMMADCYVSFAVYNHLGEEIKGDGYIHNESHSVELTAGTFYTIRVQHNSGLCDYILSIGTQKPTTDISGSKLVKDTFDFDGQINYYTLTPKESRNHAFIIGDMADNSVVKLYIYNSLGETIQSNTYCYNSYGFNVDLESNKTYTIAVVQYYNRSDYSLNVIGGAESITLNSNNGYIDNFVANDQENIYTFTATESGKHIFAISDTTMDGAYFDLYIYNSDEDCVNYDTYMNANEYLAVEDIKKGDTFTIKVIERNAIGDYTISVQTTK